MIVKMTQNLKNGMEKMYESINKDLESILSPVPKKGSTKISANHQTISLISHASKVMLKHLHAAAAAKSLQSCPT